VCELFVIGKNLAYNVTLKIYFSKVIHILVLQLLSNGWVEFVSVL